ncbi:MAG: putative ABC transporter permease [Lachnospiraceae bacterium]|nr:putative ABC transporter permease [Lachnospiraceae bacterium]
MNTKEKREKIWNLFRDYMEYFLLYALCGWIYESVWCCMIYHRRGFINRGFLFGPWLPIYGFGFFIILGIFTLLKIKKHVPVFLCGMFIATMAELAASYIIDAALGEKMWDYTGYFLNFDGRIALVPSLMFGLLIWVAICLIQPAVVKLQGKIRTSKVHNVIFIVIVILFAVDLICRIPFGSNCVG